MSALRRCEGRLSSGALPPPAARPQGGLSGSATHVLLAQVCGPGSAARPWGGRPGLGACRVCGACAVFVCWWVRCGALCAVMPWCVVLPPSVHRPGAPPLVRYLVLLCLLWLVAVPPSPRVCLVRLLATLLIPSALRHSLPFPLLSISLPSSLACIFSCLTCFLVCFSVFFLACFLVFWVLFFLSLLIL